MQVFLPFNKFKLVAILNHMNIAPSQLYPPGLGLCESFSILVPVQVGRATRPLFFNLFHVNHEG
jgi:hypothetical protein